jgi:hypothetical protein
MAQGQPLNSKYSFTGAEVIRFPPEIVFLTGSFGIKQLNKKEMI